MFLTSAQAFKSCKMIQIPITLEKKMFLGDG